MAWVLAAVALLVAALAWWEARRLRARPPLPSRPAGPPPPPAPPSADVDRALGRTRVATARLARRLDDVEARLGEIRRDLHAPPPAPPEPPPAAAADAEQEPSPEAVIREHLQRVYDASDAVLLEDPARPGCWIVEIRREGLVSKGSARFLADGRLDVRLEPTVRAFP